MTYEQFVASRAPVSDELWGVLLEGGVTDGLPRSVFFAYGGEYVLHEAGGCFWPHAWWYRPASRETRAEAEAVLWEWRKEWV